MFIKRLSRLLNKNKLLVSFIILITLVAGWHMGGPTGAAAPEDPPGPGNSPGQSSTAIIETVTFGTLVSITAAPTPVDLPGVTFTRTMADSSYYVHFTGTASVRCASSTLRFVLIRDDDVVDAINIRAPAQNLDGYLNPNNGDWAFWGLTDAGDISAGDHTWRVQAGFTPGSSASPDCVMAVGTKAVFMEFAN